MPSQYQATQPSFSVVSQKEDLWFSVPLFQIGLAFSWWKYNVKMSKYISFCQNSFIGVTHTSIAQLNPLCAMISPLHNEEKIWTFQK